MELMGDAESSSAARVTARRFFRNDPQDRGALRQGDITLIHSAPTGDDARRHSGAMRSIEPEISRFRVWRWRTNDEFSQIEA
jgi:hypothetical protein